MSKIALAPSLEKCYSLGMFLRGISIGRRKGRGVGLRLAAACALFVLTVLQGLSFCLCAHGSGACHEEACHNDCAAEPAGDHIEHNCSHFKVENLTLEERDRDALYALAGLFTTLSAGADYTLPRHADIVPRLQLTKITTACHLVYLTRAAQMRC